MPYARWKSHMLAMIGATLAFALSCFPQVASARPAADESPAVAGDCAVGSSPLARCLPDEALAGAVAQALGVGVDATLTDAHVARLTSLAARNAGIRDLTGLDAFTALESIQLSNNDIESLAPLATLPRVRALKVYANRVRDVTPLASMTTLVELGLGDNLIEDIAPLGTLDGLTTLNVSHNDIASIEALAGMPALEFLWASGNRIENAAALNALPALVGADLSRNNVRGASDVTADPKDYLVMTGQSVETKVAAVRGGTVSATMPVGYDGRTIAPMGIDNGGVFDPATGTVTWTVGDQANGTGLIATFESQGGGVSADRPYSGVLRAVIDVAGEEDASTPVDGIGAKPGKPERATHPAVATTCTDGVTTIARCFPDPKLAEAIAKRLGKTTDDTTTQAELDAVADLTARAAGIETISGLEHLRGLRTLDLSDNGISDLTPLAGLRELTEIRIYNAQIDDVSPLSGKPRLRGLGLGNNFIADFSTMGHMPALTWADIYSNEIEDVSFVRDWPMLDALWLSGNPFTDVAPLAGLDRLTRLQLESNGIDDMSPFAGFAPTQYSMNDNQAVARADVTAADDGEVRLRFAKGRAGGYLRPVRTYPEGGELDAATGEVVWSHPRRDGVYAAWFSESDDADYLYSGVVYASVRVEHADRTAPVITGVYDTLCTLGEPFDPLYAVRAHDDEDGDLTDRIHVDLDEVDVRVPGDYRVRYYVEDAAGNRTWSGRHVTVRDATIVSVKAWGATTEAGRAPTLDNYAEATWSDGTTTGEGVVWDDVGPERYAQAGSFEVHGMVRGRDVTVTVTVTGGSGPEEPDAPGTPLTAIAITGDQIRDGALLLKAGATAQIHKRLTPEDAKVDGIAWSSKDPTVATVSRYGIVTAVAPGSTDVVVEADGHRATLRVTVRERFTDVPTDALFASDVDWLSSVGITQGNPDGTFGYGRHLTRQDMAIFLYRLAKMRDAGGARDYAPDDEDYGRFKDVGRDSFGAAEILWLASTGITRGNPDGTFRGGDELTRQDMAIFLYRFATMAGDKDARYYAPEDGEYSRFKDVGRDSFGAAEILWLASVGVANGNTDGTFRGSDKLTRQDMAVFLHRMHDRLGAI